MAHDYKVNLFDSAVVSNGTNDDLFTLTNAGESVDNLTIRFTNYSASAVTVTAWVQSSSGTQADADLFLKDYPISGEDYRDIDVPRMVGGGEAAKLTVTAGAATSLSVQQMSGIKRI